MEPTAAMSAKIKAYDDTAAAEPCTLSTWSISTEVSTEHQAVPEAAAHTLHLQAALTVMALMHAVDTPTESVALVMRQQHFSHVW